MGSGPTTGIAASALARLPKAVLGDDSPVKIIEPYQMLGLVDDDLPEALGIDGVEMPRRNTMFGFAKENWKSFQLFDGAGRIKVDPHYLGLTISHERIYQHIWQDKAGGRDLYQYLRIAGHKKKRKRYGKHDFRGKIPNRVGIEKRPKLVQNKKRLGNWEADTRLGNAASTNRSTA